MPLPHYNNNDVIVVGAVYLDINLTEPVPLTSRPDGDYEIVGRGYQLAPGGSAFIFTRVLKKLGLKPLFIGQIGHDFFGQLLTRQINRDKIATDLIIRPTVQTNFSANASGQGDTSLGITAGNANQFLTASAVEPRLAKHLPKARALYIGGYFKMPQLAGLYPRLARQAKGLRRLVILDHGTLHVKVSASHWKKLYTLLPYVDYYLPNKEEFLKITRTKSLAEGFRWFKKNYQATAVIKCGRAGACLWENNRIITVPGRQVRVLHTVGAGDSFNAGLIYGILKGYPTIKAVRLANNVAALKISHHGFLPKTKLKYLLNRLT